MRVVLSILALSALAACSGGQAPDTPQGVGFNNYDRYAAEQQARRDAQLSGQNRGAPDIAQEQASAAQTPAQQTASDAVAAVRGTGQGAATPAQTAAAPARNNVGISDEQDFQAVSNRQTIESDAQRRAAQSAQYKVVEPTDLPSRPSSKAPTPIEFALSTSHPLGEKKYTRRSTSEAKAARNCARFRSADLAQDEFLKSGGPKRDKLGIDPDGDGYACSWDPATYRSLVRN